MKKTVSVILAFVLLMTVGTFLTSCTAPKEKELPDIIDENAPFTQNGSIKILTVGNSYGLDFAKYIWELLNNTGRYESVKVANLYRGSCVLDTHYECIVNNNPWYCYAENTKGVWEISDSMFSSNSIIPSDDWDIIILQHLPGPDYDAASYGHLQEFINEIKKLAPNAKLVYNSTWHPVQFDKLPLVADTVKAEVMTKPDIVALIPTGTVIENLRTAKLIPSMFRDGMHLDTGISCYAASMMCMRIITGFNTDKITWTPDGQPEVKAYLDVIKKAVNFAAATPYETVDMSDTETNGLDYTKDADIFKAYGLDINSYTKVELSLTKNKYYKTKSDALKASGKHYATQIFNEDTLPVGSVIITDDTTTAVTVKWKDGANGVESGTHWDSPHTMIIGEDFWNGYTSCGINIRHYSIECDSSYVNTNGISIYVPKK